MKRSPLTNADTAPSSILLLPIFLSPSFLPLSAVTFERNYLFSFVFFSSFFDIEGKKDAKLLKIGGEIVRSVLRCTMKIILLANELTPFERIVKRNYSKER